MEGLKLTSELFQLSKSAAAPRSREEVTVAACQYENERESEPFYGPCGGGAV